MVAIPRYPSVVLISEHDSLPLACISVKSQDRNGSISCKNDGIQYMAKRNVRYELIITNTNTIGEIKIDFMKNNQSVRTVDPGTELGGLNCVNELRILQSYAIRGDQKDSLPFFLHEQKDYHISVVPRADNEKLKKRFGNTRWHSSDLICICIPKDTKLREVSPRISREILPKVNTRGTTSSISYEYDVPTNLDEHLIPFTMLIGYEEQTPLTRGDALAMSKIMINEAINKSANTVLDNINVYEEKECVICMDSDIDIDSVLYDCGHKCCHYECSLRLDTCPICRKDIVEVIKI
jgi:hypothetical protein